MHASPALYTRGPYRVVAEATGEPERRYLVIDIAGITLREEEDFCAACEWVDRRMAGLDAVASSLKHTPVRRGRA